MADKRHIIPTLLVLVAVLTAGCYPPAGPPQLANPATQYCLDHGGSTQPRGYTGEGPSGLCVFPDDSVCDEWAFFRGECGPASQPLDEPNPATTAGTSQPAISDVDAFLLARLEETFIRDTSALVQIQTYRDDSPDSEGRVTANLERIRDYLGQRVNSFNEGQRTLKVEPFEWQEQIDGVDRWVFGFRVGNGPRKFSMLTHMDTVLPGDDAWQPFEPRVEVKEYRDRTVNIYAPDVRDPQGVQLQTVSRAYEDVMGVACLQFATGGGTDAKGFLSPVAARALFSNDFGPPINYHGLDKGAPVEDLRNSTLILYHILLRQVGGVQ